MGANLLLLAQQGTAGQQGGNPLLFTGGMIVLMFVMFYFMVIKPQKRKQQEHDEMLQKLKAGDRVVTAGGIYGNIVQVKDRSFIVEIAKGVRIEVSRASVSVKVVEKGEGEEAAKDEKQEKN